MDLISDNMFGPEVRVHPDHVTLAEGRCGYVDVDINHGWNDEDWYYHASSTNERIARIGCPGPPWYDDTLPANITGVSPGWATLTFSVSTRDVTVSDEAEVLVTEVSARSLTLSANTVTIFVGQPLWLEAFPKDGTGHALFAHDIKWSSADTAVASAERADWGTDKPIGVGCVLGRRVGRTTVTATVDGVRASAGISVVDSI